MRIGTAPRRPTTMRTMSDATPRIGMKSITVTAPSGVSKSRFQDQGVVAIAPLDPADWAVRSDQPAAILGLPSRAAKQASESNRGQHSQSIEPSRPTSAAVSQSPIRA